MQEIKHVLEAPNMFFIVARNESDGKRKQEKKFFHNKRG